MDSCLFCKISNGEIPSTKVYEDDTVLSFLDIHPVNIGHTLVIPKKHYPNLYMLPDDILKEMSPMIKKIAIAIKESLGCDGINIAMNNDSAAGQVIDHAHIHIIPRHEGDGFAHWKGKRKYTEDEIAQTAIAIKNQL
ncbi:MAG: HIT family protein [Candidatus Pacebacteria bacterium]|jgi:histidine triad (HIT) family protein|nr:HIT family protein [Candidatus Paceibacterota bacterium]